MIVNRYRYIEQLSRSKNNGLIKIITGLRRSGKSFLLKKLFHQHLLDEGVREDHILVIDMESRKNREFKNPDYLLDWVEKMMIDYETYYIIIDEVQEVEDFVEVLSSLSVTEGADVYVTGSNSRFLSSDLVTEFRGRGDEIHVWPLSFKEFMTVYDGSKEDGWAEYRLYGGLPQLLTQVGDEKKADFLRRLYRTVYLRDIYERNNIELRSEFEELSKTVASSIGAPVNALNIANTFKSVSNVQSITDKTVSAYLEYMQDAFLIEKSERFDIKGRKYIGSLSKYYYQDVGLRNAILSFRQSEPTHIMENVIYNEMRMRGWLVDVGNVYHRVRNTEGKQQRVTLEVDFVCNKGSERIYIQSAWRMPDAEKMEQEKRSLRLVDDSFRKLLIVGEHTKQWSDENGIQIMSIYDFLLDWSSTEKHG
ncbi:ATP-binding protein [Bacteroides uniformis]|uniref:ATP-binding protein n=1 Tax=Bacteroides uniformis TaxID=820 RepID=A0AAW6H0I4_BACUN|nr:MULTISPECIES: ATP-binding protein [Bacteroidaceae]MDB0775952.1 ATP-binding protein [Phocaeicola vulgatus]MDB0784519.1 ATP-binding protein [Phocaeicola vulgatus]MDB0829743.1 ATP-binding protein [Phocaeicola vulgatus]MDC1576914.1 ATP-binding protein [Phocaeicola vulgatus]MDC1590023.1 ATP-binding protein [Phocaeicola vulgatus]